MYMDIVWFGLAVLFLVLWLVKKPKSHDNTIDLNSKNYAQGYWDGHRAHEKESSGVNIIQKKVVSPIKSIDNVKTLNQLEQLDVVMPESTQSANYSMATPTNSNNAVIDLAAHKAKRDLQNINTTLYVASFLLVAAVAIFVGTSLPESIRFVGVWFVTIIFYVAGLVLYKTVERLRPAAVAFVGTGLALLPFTGIAMYSFMIQDTAMCWLVTSIIGIVAFIYAAILLRNQVIAYLAIAFGVSLATSSVAVLDVGLIWYFVVLILFGCVMTMLAKFKFPFIPDCFSKPIDISNNWIVPLTIVASLVAFNGMSVQDYWVISLVSALYYGAVAVSSVQGRDMSIFITRLLASIALILMAYDFSSDSWTVVGFTLSFIGLLQVIISAMFIPKRVAGDSNNETWLWIGLAIQFVASLVIYFDQDVSWALIITGQLLALLIASFGLSYLLRRAIVSIFGTIALAILPIIWGLQVITPAIEYQSIALIFLVFAVISLVVRSIKTLVTNSPSIRPFLVVNFALFLFESLIFTIDISADWGLVIWITATLLVYGLMYLERQPWLSVVANIMISISIWRFVVPEYESYWVSLIFISLALFMLAVRSLTKLVDRFPSVRYALLVNIGMFIILALFYTADVELGWKLTIWLTATAIVYGITYIERTPWSSIIANLIFIASCIWLVELVEISDKWKFLVISWIAFAVFYCAYWLTVLYSKRNYGMYFWWSAIIFTGLINLLSLTVQDKSIVIYAGIGSVGVAVAIAIEGWRIRRYEYIDVAAIIATIGMQRILYIMATETNVLVYTHWWSVIFVGLSYLYYSSDKKKDAKILLYVALVTMSLFSGMAALGWFGESDIPYQTVFLVEHVLLVILGLVLSRKLFTIWGAVGVILSVLWMMKDQKYLLLASAALVLIGWAVYALIRKSKNPK